ncbi:response regulator [Massilia sp. H-1]|nr:response regulator [Massilia sp. H-1]
MLESNGCVVAAAADGIEGLRQAALAPYDVALVDIGLPRMDGYEVARRLRADPATRGMRLIALTGYGQENDRAMALDAASTRTWSSRSRCTG